MIDFGQRQPRGHQKRGPVDAVEAHDLLADHVHVGGPVLARTSWLSVVGAVAERGDVIGQRIEPDINHMLGIVGHRNAPVERGAADRKIAQAAAHKGNHFVAPRLRPDEVGLLGVELQQLVLQRRELEEVILFLHRFGRAAAFRDTARPAPPHRRRVRRRRNTGRCTALVDVAALRAAARTAPARRACAVGRWCG